MFTLSDVQDAAKRIAPYLQRTPLLRAEALDALVGCEVYLKAENLQPIGAFKLRGALNAMLQLSPLERSQGVVACSSGNHALGMAYAAKQLDIDTVIVIPQTISRAKLIALDALGAKELIPGEPESDKSKIHVVFKGSLASERDEEALRISREEGRTLIHPYKGDIIHAGQGSVALEILEDNPDIDTIIVPVGGGGLLCGIAVTAKAMKPDIRIVGAEPAGAPRYAFSRAAQSPMPLSSADTIADGTRTDHADPDNFRIIEEYVDDLVAASDHMIRKAVYNLALYSKMVVEPSAALGIAAAAARRASVYKKNKVCFVLTGGNIDPLLLAEILQKG